MLSSSGQSGGNLIAHCAQHTCMEGRSSFERSLFPFCWLIHVSTFSCRFLAKLAKCWLTRLSGECEILAGHWTLHPDTLILRLIPQLQAELYQHAVSKLDKILLLFLRPVMHRTIWAVPVVSVQSLMSNWNRPLVICASHSSSYYALKTWVAQIQPCTFVWSLSDHNYHEHYLYVLWDIKIRPDLTLKVAMF